MFKRHLAPILAVPFVLVACGENPTGSDGHEDELTVELTVSPDHLHTLAPVTFTAVVRDGHGTVVMDLDTLRVERSLDGGEWRKAADLSPGTGSFTGTYTFSTSGEYEFRVSGMRTGHGSMMEIPMAQAMEPMHVGRAHEVVGGYRVEFESFPGHIHEGSEVAFRFWVKEAQADASGNRAPITGLAGQVLCGEPAGGSETHSPLQEVEPGIYEALHTFQSAGDATAALHFTGTGGEAAEATFDFHVAHPH